MQQGTYMRLSCSARWCETTISAAEPCCSNVHVGEHERDSEQHQFLNHSRPSHSPAAIVQTSQRSRCLTGARRIEITSRGGGRPMRAGVSANIDGGATEGGGRC